MESRPKIHRLPRQRKRFNLRRPSEQLLSTIWRTGALGVGVLAFVLAVNAVLDVSDNENNLLRPREAHASTPAGTPMTRYPVGKQEGTIILTDDSGTIVGHMAKIPPGEQEQTAEVKVLSTVDKRHTQDLLSILGKY